MKIISRIFLSSSKKQRIFGILREIPANAIICIFTQRSHHMIQKALLLLFDEWMTLKERS
jgi:hypothetical protein